MLNKRVHVGVVTAVAASLLLAACGAGSGDAASQSIGEADGILTELTEDVTVTVWHTLTDHHEEELLKQIEQFNSEQDHITVVAQPQPLTDFDSHVQQAVRNGQGPNLIFSSPNAASAYIEDDFIVDLTPYIEHSEIGVSNFEDRIISALAEEASQWGGRYYLFPQLRTGEVLFYNATLYEELGLDVPTTWEQLAENSRIVTERTGRPAFGFDSLVDGVTLLIMQSGGSILDPEAMQSTVNSGIAAQVFEDLLPLYEDGVYRLVGEDQYFSNPFGAGDVASYIGSSAGYGFVEDAVGDSFEVGVAPVPQVEGGTPYVNSWGRFGMVFDGTPEENLAAYTYLVWSTMTPEVAAEYSIVYGSVPASLEAQETDAYQAFAEATPVIAALLASLEYVGYQPAVSGANEVRESLGRAAEVILLGEADVATALEDAEAAANEALGQ